MDSFMPTAADFDAGRVTNANQSEVIKARYYDWLLYATAGATVMNFFSTAIGQGFATALGSTAGTPKTKSDTNLVLPNQLPSGVEFLIDSIEVHFLPGSVNTANTYTPAAISVFNATAAAAVLGAINDVNTILQSGVLTLTVLNKTYVVDGPLYTFPPKTWIEHTSAIASNAAVATGEVAAGNARAMGRPWYVEPKITLQPAVNFGVKIEWPGVVATPSGFNGRIGVIMDGFEMRASQ